MVQFEGPSRTTLRKMLHDSSQKSKFRQALLVRLAQAIRRRTSPTIGPVHSETVPVADAKTL
jgi:hypothetical protein